MPTHISSFAIAPLFIASFMLAGFQYFRINPMRRVLNPQFGLMFGAIVLVVAAGTVPRWSLVLFAVSVVWLATTLFMFRTMPPPKH
ncbi:MAG TPA: hypothetical protein VKB76_03735 [Ktedonobacterales bacterium]|nr:hypothetical protein [Ktedonobacterales bacterium]